MFRAKIGHYLIRSGPLGGQGGAYDRCRFLGDHRPGCGRQTGLMRTSRASGRRALGSVCLRRRSGLVEGLVPDRGVERVANLVRCEPIASEHAYGGSKHLCHGRA